MSILHLVNRSHSLPDVAGSLSAGDTLVLCGDAVVQTQVWPAQVALCAMAEDLEARGMAPAAGVRTLDYAALVELCCSHAQVIAW
ncbi:MAG: sulfurtransferase complex subunit TusB [Gammaproteobacteria bacterium]|nr:sulfurtransferase complex subunit TusB [Gammaproteobacteria bacterium]